MVVFYLAAALIAGAFVVLQTGANARLKDVFVHPIGAVIVSSQLGVVLLLGALAILRTSPIPVRPGGLPWWAWMGGILGAAYAVTVVILARPLGAATLTALVVTGQLVCSVILDHFGLMGFDVHPTGVMRVIGCLLLLAGLGLIWKF
jgi:transporter family-2 protein